MLGNNAADDEKARMGENALRMSKCHTWIVLTRAKCHGSLLTLWMDSFTVFSAILLFYCNTTKAKEAVEYKMTIWSVRTLDSLISSTTMTFTFLVFSELTQQQEYIVLFKYCWNMSVLDYSSVVKPPVKPFLGYTTHLILFSEAWGWLQALLADNVRSRIVYHFKLPFLCLNQIPTLNAVTVFLSLLCSFRWDGFEKVANK